MNKLFVLPIVALLNAATPVRAASGCEAALAATMKVLQVPSHLYMTETAGFNNKGKTRNLESIYLNGATFVMVGGKWIKSVITPQDLTDMKKTAERKVGTCSEVREEAVSGELATLYKIHNQNEAGTIDTQLWVSKSRGLPLKQIDDIDVGAGAAGKSHQETRYEYTNVTAPAVTESKRK